MYKILLFNKFKMQGIEKSKENWVETKVELRSLTEEITREKSKERIDNAPEITMDDINKLSDKEVINIFNWFKVNREKAYHLNQKTDKNWDYIIVKGKKLYIQYYFWDHNILKSQKPCLMAQNYYGAVDSIMIWKYSWKWKNYIDWIEYVGNSSSIWRWRIEIPNELDYWFN